MSTFLGSRDVLVTSWVNLGMYELDFIGSRVGPRLRYAEGLIVYCDGLVQLMEANPTSKGSINEAPDMKKTSWYDEGVDVSVYLEKGAMGKLLCDGQLRKYDHRY